MPDPTPPPAPNLRVVEIKLTPERIRIVYSAGATFIRLVQMVGLSSAETIFILHELLHTLEDSLGLEGSAVAPPDTPTPTQSGGNA